MFKNTLTILLFISLTLVGCDKQETDAPAGPAPQKNNPYAEGPAIWKVSDDDTTLYLLGTVHLLKAETDWRSETFETVWGESETVYFETDVSIDAQLKMQQLMNSLGMNEEGVTLSSFFNEDEQEILTEGTRRAKLPLAMLEPMRPWLAMLIISVQQYITEGADPTAGVDYVLGNEARTVGKETRFFETNEQQINFFADFDDEATADMLIEGLVYGRDHPDLFDDMTADWLNGRPDKLADMLNDSMTANAELTQVLLYNRNETWVEELTDVIENEQGTFLVAVGAGHLAGKKSVQDFLAQKGYVAERL